MPFIKILKIANRLFLFLSLISVSGFTAISSNYESTKTELLYSKPSVKTASFAQYNYSTKIYQSLIYNQYIVFYFKCLFNIHNLDFTTTLKSQNKTKLELIQNPLLEQNLIAQINTSIHQHDFIK